MVWITPWMVALANQSLQSMFPSSWDIGYLPIGHRQDFLFWIIGFHVIRINHESPMHPQKTMGFQVTLKEFDGMGNHSFFTFFQVKLRVVDITFYQYYTVDQYFSRCFMI